MTTQTNSSEQSIKTIISVIFVSIALIYGCNQLLCNSTEKDTTKYTQEQKDSLDRADFLHKYEATAYVASQEFVKQRLKSPSTSNFPLGSAQYCKYLGDSVFVINAFVDSQNSYGAILRNKYSAKIKLKGTSDWEILDLSLFE